MAICSSACIGAMRTVLVCQTAGTGALRMGARRRWGSSFDERATWPTAEGIRLAPAHRCRPSLQCFVNVCDNAREGRYGRVNYLHELQRRFRRLSRTERWSLKLWITKLQRMQFGRKSEKIDRQIEQLELRLEDLQANEGTTALEARCGSD